MAKKLSPIEKFLALSDAEKDAEVAPFEQEVPKSSRRALNSAERKQWQRVKRKLGRPSVGQGAKLVAVTIEKGLLKEADRYAKEHDLKRSEMIAQGLRLVMTKKTA